MSDYRIRISVRNARLLRAIEQAGYRSGAPFAAAVGISYYRSLLPYLNLMRSPLTPDGLLRECAWSLCDFLHAAPSYLWSDAQLQPLAKSHSSLDLKANAVQTLICGTAPVDQMQLDSQEQAGRILQDAIDSLTPHEANVIRERFFAGASLDDVAEQLEVSRERARQIECKALRKFRHKSQIPRELVGSANVIEGNADA
jgi:RNA polymerase sigma factor (sigma-70 family)